MAGLIAVVGSTMTDLITYVDRMPAAGETLAAPRFAMGRGGKGANQAVAAARLGSRVLFVTRVGEDMFGRAALEAYEREGIDTTHARALPGVASGVAPIFVEPSGENRILIVKGANEHLLPADIDAAAAAIGEATMIVLQLEIPLDTVYQTIALGRSRGIPVLLNPAPATRALDRTKLDGVTYFVPNQTELSILTGMPTDSVATAERAARELIADGIGTVIVTLGGDGALLVTAARSVQIPPVKVTPVDTTGAGDAFIGSLVHHLDAGHGIGEALRQAARYAADSITRPGTQSAFATAAAFAAFEG